jgi:hypothetical protein
MSEEEFEPTYQEGKTSVSSKNLDAAGSDHPLGQDSQPFEGSMRHLIRRVADDLYESWEATIREYLSNAETACLRVQRFIEDGDATTLGVDTLHGIGDGYEPRIEVVWDASENKLTIRDNGIGMAAEEVNKIFLHIGNSAVRDSGSYSGQFGMGVLSFVKLIGLDNSMVMTTHSRQTDENFSSYISLPEMEPIMGTLPDNEYGTKFQMTPKESFDIRKSVQRFSEWMRVPVIYREFDKDGKECFNEDWGDKEFTEFYGENDVTITFDSMDEYFVAYCSDKAPSETLLLSMPIERNCGVALPSPFDIDIRLMNESGPVIRSTNGNEGLVPVPRSDYESMLLEARAPCITEDMLSNDDVLGQRVAAGENEGSMVVNDESLSGDRPLPPNDYIPKSEVQESDEPGKLEVIFGTNAGKRVVEQDVWEQMDEGRASMYVPEDVLEPYDIDSKEGDLCLPEPTGDRDRLQKNTVFWRWLGLNFKTRFEEMIYDTHNLIQPTDDPVEDISNMDAEDFIESTIEEPL